MAIPVNTSPTRSQRDVRTVRIFTDEHGRQWRATVNNLGIHAGYPVSPLTPLFEAPIYPPSQYIKIDDIASGQIHIDTQAWLEDRLAAHAAYELLKQQQAVQLYGDGAAAAIERGDKALFFRIGQPPFPIEQVEAYEQGHPWVLGFDLEKPESLEPFFPEPQAVQRRRFTTAAEERNGTTETPKRRYPGRPPKVRRANGDVA